MKESLTILFENSPGVCAANSNYFEQLRFLQFFFHSLFFRPLKSQPKSQLIKAAIKTQLNGPKQLIKYIFRLLHIYRITIELNQILTIL